VSNSLTIDGIDAVNIHTNSLVENAYSSNGSVIPSPETVQEFKVQTGLYDAQYGRNAGANVNLVTRTGTSALHGNVFEFFRNEALNANSYFLKRNGVAKPILRQNQFGGTLGGPLLIKDTFFFVGYRVPGNTADQWLCRIGYGHNAPTWFRSFCAGLGGYLWRQDGL